MSQQESVARSEGNKKEGLKFNLGDKLKGFLVEKTNEATAEVKKTHGELVTDQDLSEMEQNSLRDVAQMATQQLEAVTGYQDLAERLEQIQAAEAAGDGERLSLLQSQIGALWMQLEGGEAFPVKKTEEPTVVEPSLPEVVTEAPVAEEEKTKTVQGYLEQADKEIKLLQEKIPTLKGRAYAQAVQRLEDLVDYERALAAEAGESAENVAPEVAAGQNWEEALNYEREQLERVVQMKEAARESLERFKEAHAASPGLTPIEQQYVWTLESDLNCYKAKAEFIENSILGIAAQKTLQDLPETPENAAALQQAKGDLAKAVHQKVALEAALVAAAAVMQEARGSYTPLLKEAGVDVEEEAHEEDGLSEIERAQEWSFGPMFEPGDAYRGRGIGAEQTGPKEKEIFTLHGGQVEKKEEEGFLHQTWKGLSGWLKSLFG